MRYLSVCSGIEAASVAWKPLGWECAGVSEIDKFPRAVLQHRLGAVPVDDGHRWAPGQNITPLFGDFTKIEEHHVGPIDLLVGGTPCQSFSIAGKRLGLDDPRGNLTLEFLALAVRVRAKFILWENVPGVLSHDEGRTFGTFLGLVGECGYRGAYRVLDAQYCRVGRFGRAVPQRRRRLFFVGYSGTADINPAAVLFDRESLRGNPAPCRQAGEGIAPTLAARTRGGGGLGTDFDCDGGLIAGQHGPAISPAMKARDSKGPSSDGDGDGLPVISVAHSLRAEGFDASEDGTGRGTPIVPVAPTLRAGGNDTGGTRPYGTDADTCDSLIPVQHPVAIQERAVSENPDAGPDGKGWRDDGAAYTLEARATVQAVAFAENTRAEIRLCGGDGAVSSQLTTGGGKPGQGSPCVAFSAKDHPPAIAMLNMQGAKSSALAANDGACFTLNAMHGHDVHAVAAAWGVRRLTPRECARLQGFPDDWAMIPWRGKPAEECPDGPQYRAYGNSMAVNVMCWIGERIAAVAAAGEGA
jgi:DNA (cytosine-5)-methyltransferase 1